MLSKDQLKSSAAKLNVKVLASDTLEALKTKIVQGMGAGSVDEGSRLETGGDADVKGFPSSDCGGPSQPAFIADVSMDCKARPSAASAVSDGTAGEMEPSDSREAGPERSANVTDGALARILSTGMTMDGIEQLLDGCKSRAPDAGFGSIAKSVNSKKKSKDELISEIVKCRPEGGSSAGELLSWLIKVISLD